MINQHEYFNLAQSMSSCTETAALTRNFRRYCDASRQCPELDAADYIRDSLPPDGHVLFSSLIQNLESPRTNAAMCLLRYFKNIGYDVLDTICGYAVCLDAVNELQRFLELSVPIRSVYERCCKKAGTPGNLPEYHKLITLIRKSVRKERYHPCSMDTEFLLGTRYEARQLVSAYLNEIRQVRDDAPAALLTPKIAANRFQIPEKKMFAWMHGHTERCTALFNELLISNSTLIQLESEWKQTIRLDEGFVKKHIPTIRAETISAIVNSLGTCHQAEPFLLEADAYPQQQPSCSYCRSVSEGVVAVEAVRENAYSIELKLLSSATDYKMSRLLRLAETGVIAAEEIAGKYYLTYSEYDRHMECFQGFVPLETAVEAIFSEVKHDKFLMKYIKCREALLDYCEENKWWGLTYLPAKNTIVESGQFGIVIRKTDVSAFSNHIRLFVATYGQSSEEKFFTIVDAYKSGFPAAAQMLLNSFRDPDECPPNLWQFADMLFYCLRGLKKDIDQLSRKEIHQIAAQFHNECSLVCCNTLAVFLQKNSIFDARLFFDRSGYKRPEQAYPIKSFAIIVGYAINPSLWSERELIGKAIENVKFARLWLYVACHAYSTLRNTDYVRLEPPFLNCDPDAMLREIYNRKDEIYIDADSPFKSRMREITDVFLAGINWLALEPHKTKRAGNVTPLYFYVPESNYDTFGIILAIATAHYLKGDKNNSFIDSGNSSKKNCMDFFGPQFVDACENRGFSGKRAVKSLLQSVSMEANDSGEVGPYVAYVLASIMRSHKGGYAKLAETTEIYLRDANFANLTPEFVAKELFERGIFSFITDELMNKCFGQEYTTLNVHDKTSAIKAVGMDAFQINNLRKTVLAAQDQAYQIVESFARDRDTARKILDNLLRGRSLGKSLSSDCFCMAADLNCRCPRRQNCFGCIYEIKSKAVYQTCLREWQRLTAVGNSSKQEQERNLYLKNTVIDPMITELLSHFPENLTKEELGKYQAFMDARGIKGETDGTNQTN